MLDSIVQFIRNGLCCIKDLGLFPESFLWDPSVTAIYYEFPEPMNKTTPLEIVICVTQFYAFYSTTWTGYRLITEGGIGKLRRLAGLSEMSITTSNPLVTEMVQESLANERSAAYRSIFIGANVMSIGLCFFWLFSNSLHITETNWIGGLQGLIHALTVMEIALLPLLYYMFVDGIRLFVRAGRMNYLSSILRKSKGGLSSAVLNAEVYSMIVTGGWSPFWSSGYRPFEPLPDEMEETKKFNEELSRLETTLDALLGEKVITARRVKALTQTLQETAARMDQDAYVTRLEGLREFFYLVINWVAFYGYLLGILAYYFDQEDVQPFILGIFKFGLSNADADWHGNFAGDFMWTIEPLVILGSPHLMTWMKPKAAKVKSD